MHLHWPIIAAFTTKVDFTTKPPLTYDNKCPNPSIVYHRPLAIFTMPFCDHCGAQVSPSAKYCRSCGGSLLPESSQPLLDVASVGTVLLSPSAPPPPTAIATAKFDNIRKISFPPGPLHISIECCLGFLTITRSSSPLEATGEEGL